MSNYKQLMLSLYLIRQTRFELVGICKHYMYVFAWKIRIIHNISQIWLDLTCMVFDHTRPTYISCRLKVPIIKCNFKIWDTDPGSLAQLVIYVRVGIQTSYSTSSHL